MPDRPDVQMRCGLCGRSYTRTPAGFIRPPRTDDCAHQPADLEQLVGERWVARYGD